MRRNIDPFSEHSDLELWRVLDEVPSIQAISYFLVHSVLFVKTKLVESELRTWIHVL